MSIGVIIDHCSDLLQDNSEEQGRMIMHLS